MISKVIPNGKLPAGKSKMDHSVLVTMGIFLFSRLIMAYKISKLQEKFLLKKSRNTDRKGGGLMVILTIKCPFFNGFPNRR